MRVPKAYPMYDADYAERVEVDQGLARRASSNLQQVGRNGLHRYNNSDHSMLTAMRAVDNLMTGSNHDLWAVNAESAYHEEHQEPEQPYKRVPTTQYEREPLHATEEAAALGGHMSDWLPFQGAAILIPRLRRAFGQIASHGGGSGRIRRFTATSMTWPFLVEAA